MARQGLAGLTALHVGMDDLERQVVGLAIGERPLAAQPVRARHLAMVGGEDDDGRIGQAQRIEFGEQRRHRPVHVADAVDVVVVEPLPAHVLERDVTQDMVPNAIELAVRRRPSRRVERLAKGRGHRHVPAVPVERVFGRAGGMQAQPAAVLHALARRIGVEVHDVVRIDEAHRHAPRLALVRQRPARGAQPVDGAAGGEMVEAVAPQRMADQVAGREIVGEAVSLHLRRHERADLARVGRLAEMPLALVGRVVAGLAQHVPQRRMRERQVAHPRHVEIFEHAVVGSLQPRHHHRARRGAHRRRTLVVREGDPPALQMVVPRQRQALRPLRVIALLIGEDEENVGAGAAAARGGNDGRCGRLALRPSDARQSRPEEGGGGGARGGRKESPSRRIRSVLLVKGHGNARY